MKRYLFSLLTLILFTLTAAATTPETQRSPKKTVTVVHHEASPLQYRLVLKDKAESPYTVQHPEKFLSKKSLERRARYGLHVDHHDLPVSPAYLHRIRETGAHVLNCSKWNNTVKVALADSTDGTLAALRALPFVEDVLLVYVAPEDFQLKDASGRHDELVNKIDSTRETYGRAQRQVEQIGVPGLHDLGFRGAGMTIAIIDGGFYNADCIEALSTVRILGTRNFVRPSVDVYEEHPHGMMVLSCLAPDLRHQLIGTAPEASYYLLQSEDTYYEYRGEEDNWCAALEYADSLGVDVVTSSLGYTSFDTPAVKLQYHWLDGQHELNSRSASLAASRGIMLCNSAGNEGDGAWKKIGFPADARDILTVGAVDRNDVAGLFSSLGYSADGRVKPDCMAPGVQTTLLGTDGTITTANGTSFACPLMAGAVTCLMQACPKATPLDIIDAIHHTASDAEHPNEIYGYGTANVYKAYKYLTK